MSIAVPSPRVTFALIALFCAGLLGFGYYLQFQLGEKPCPLCISQRVCFLLAGLVGLVAALHHPGRVGQRLYALTGGLLALVGAAIAARHIWIQHLPPDKVPACGPGLAYMLENFPLLEAVRLALRGDGNCAEIGWTLLGLSISEWSLLAFVGLIIAYAWQGWRR